MTPTPEQTNQQWQKVQREGKYGGPRYKVGGPPPRKQWNMSAKDVAKLLDNPAVAECRSIGEASIYRRYAYGNDTVLELADDLANGCLIALAAYLDDLEKNILRDAAGFNLIGPVVNPVPIDEDEKYRAALEAEGAAMTKDLEQFADRKGAHKHLKGIGANTGFEIHNEADDRPELGPELLSIISSVQPSEPDGK